ncbi:uncharacterized protein [Watersipora subatra]|uniref:uncharacterized protein n=1 Tax=Watersipora subatra TaxID=2589382 RepID=UPI00355B3380
MSAAALTKKFLATDFLTEEENFFECLCAVLEEFIATKNPIFPRQDIIVQLMKVLTGSSNIQLIKLVLTTLIEFSDSSTTYSAEFVKRLLISHKIVRILCLVLSSNRLYKDKMLSELSLSLLRRLSDILLPVEMSIVLTDILPLCVSLCNVKKQILFAFRPAIKQKLTELVINKSVVMQEQLYETGVTQEKCDLMLSLFGCK